MKRLAVVMALGLSSLFVVLLAQGQVAKKDAATESSYLRYEGRLNDAQGAGLSGDYDIVFRLYDSPTSLTSLWEESHRVYVVEGNFEVTLGRRSPLPSLEGNTRYLGVSVGGEELSPRQLLSVEPGDQALLEAPPGGELIVNPPHLSGFFDDHFVNVTGDSMTGDLIVDANVFITGTGTLSPVLTVENTAGGTVLSAEGYGSSNNTIVGVSGVSSNSSTGNVYGGLFTASEGGTGYHYGLRAEGWGGTSTWTYGVYGIAENTSSGNVYAGYFNASSSGTGTHYGVYGFEGFGGSGAAIYAAGDMVASGAKPAVIKTSQGHRLLYAQESPEVWFEDVGRDRLVNGKAHVELDPLFLETVTIDEDHPMEVFIQVTDENCRGTAVRGGMTGFDVIELAGGTSNATFSYRVMAKRRGYEDERLRETDVGYDDPNLYPELLAQMEWEEERQKRQQASLTR